ncbi:hypothetical protein CCYA_CCYA16G4171 [Cyanidiococcus yangmingshanensis]|nr:hypothetical protein CCYA_CCYA16G4171 [Cyanidiococcus yangmingshanensis]
MESKGKIAGAGVAGASTRTLGTRPVQALKPPTEQRASPTRYPWVGPAARPMPGRAAPVPPIGANMDLCREALQLRILRSHTALCSGWVEARKSSEPVRLPTRPYPRSSSGSISGTSVVSERTPSQTDEKPKDRTLRREFSSPDLGEFNRLTVQERKVPHRPTLPDFAHANGGEGGGSLPPTNTTGAVRRSSQSSASDSSQASVEAATPSEREPSPGLPEHGRAASGRTHREGVPSNAPNNETSRQALAKAAAAANTHSSAPPGITQKDHRRERGKGSVAKTFSKLLLPRKLSLETLAKKMTFGLVGKKSHIDPWKEIWAEVRAGLLIFYQYNKTKSRGQPCPFAIVPLLGCTVYSRTVDQCHAEKERGAATAGGRLSLPNGDGSLTTKAAPEECPCQSAYLAASRAQKGSTKKVHGDEDGGEDGPLVLHLQPNPEFLHRSSDPAHGSSFRSIKMRFRTVEELFHWHHVLSLYSSQRVVTRADFDLICLLGRGAFGRVALARDLLGSGSLVSIKFIDKRMIFSSRDKLRRMVDERLILQAVTGKPFFVRLLYAFETGDALCMVNDFCEGGDLFHFLSVFAQYRERQWRAREEAGEKIDWDRFRRMRRAIPISVARFIAAEILVALEFLHRSDIVYRDLKPENVLFDSQGHIRLTDFGLARILEAVPAQTPATLNEESVSAHGASHYIKPGRHAISDVSSPSSSSSSSSPDSSFVAALEEVGDHARDAYDKADELGSASSDGHTPTASSGEPTHVRQRATSFCGTKSYISPEMLKTRARLLHGYGFSVDIWAYGVLLYDMLVGRPPFYSSDRERSFALTMTARLSIPDFVDATSADLLTRLLEKNERKRLGCESAYATDFEKIKRHPFFDGIDWSLVQERRLPVPAEITEVLQLGPEAARKAGVDPSHIDWLVRNFDRRFTESDMDSLIASLNRSFDDIQPLAGAGAQAGTKNADPNACKRNCAGSIPGFMFTYEAATTGAQLTSPKSNDRTPVS